MLEARHEVQVKTAFLITEFNSVPVHRFIEKQGELMTIAGKQQVSYSRMRHGTSDFASARDLENRLMGLVVLEKNKKIDQLRKRVTEKRATIDLLRVS